MKVKFLVGRDDGLDNIVEADVPAGVADPGDGSISTQRLLDWARDNLPGQGWAVYEVEGFGPVSGESWPHPECGWLEPGHD